MVINLTKEKILENSNIVVEKMGRSPRTKIYVDKDKEPEYGVFERSYSGFGLEICFVEKSEDLCAIWFEDELVFSTVTEYDSDRYGANSKYFTRLDLDDLREVYEEGDWEEVLNVLAENYEEIQAKQAEMSKAAEKMNARITQLNEDMLTYLPFKYRGGNEEMFPDREYKNGNIFVCGRGYDREALQVYVNGHEVFDFKRMYLEEGPWLSVIESVISPKRRSKPEKVSDDWLDKLYAELHYQPRPEKKAAADYLKKLKKMIE